jgi:hypothetical protein
VHDFPEKSEVDVDEWAISRLCHFALRATCMTPSALRNGKIGVQPVRGVGELGENSRFRAGFGIVIPHWRAMTVLDRWLWYLGISILRHPEWESRSDA